MPALRLAFQQVISFSNLNAAAGNYPPLEVMAEREGDQLLVTGSYFAMGGAPMTDRPGADLYRNFSPTLGFQGDHFALASHRELAKRILDAPRAKPSTTATGELVDNTVIEIWPMELAIAGELNREPLIAQQMLNTGKAREVVAAEVDFTLQLLKQLESATLRLQASDSALVLSLKTQQAQDSNAARSR
jgi:hypothetical protein